MRNPSWSTTKFPRKTPYCTQHIIARNTFLAERRICLRKVTHPWLPPVRRRRRLYASWTRQMVALVCLTGYDLTFFIGGKRKIPTTGGHTTSWLFGYGSALRESPLPGEHYEFRGSEKKNHNQKINSIIQTDFQRFPAAWIWPQTKARTPNRGTGFTTSDVPFFKPQGAIFNFSRNQDKARKAKRNRKWLLTPWSWSCRGRFDRWPSSQTVGTPAVIVTTALKITDTCVTGGARFNRTFLSEITKTSACIH